MAKEVQTVPGSMTLRGAAALLVDPSTTHPTFPVVDRHMRVLGMIDPPAIIRWRREGHQRTAALAQLLDGTNPPIAHPDEYLTTVVEKMNSANVAHLPVVARNDGCLVGYLGWKDIIGSQTHSHTPASRTLSRNTP
jgi:CBS domain-containing protein